MSAALHQNLAIRTICFTLLLSAGCGEHLRQVPSDLLGIWETEQGGYQGHSLEIRQDLILFGGGAEEAASYTVVGSIREELEAGIGYTIVYEDPNLPIADSQQLRLRLAYDPAVKALRLRNRPQVIWYQRGTTRLPERAPRPSGGGESSEG